MHSRLRLISRLPTDGRRRARRATSANRARTAGTSRLFATARASSAAPAEAPPAVPEKTRRRTEEAKKRLLSHRRRPPQGCGRRAASLVSSSSLRALAAGSGMRRARGCSGPRMEKGQPNEETEARRRSARPLRRADEHHHRETRGWSAPLEEALGP